MRLDKMLSDSGVAARSELKKMIKNGKVTVNGTVVKDPGFHVEGNEDIRVDGGEVQYRKYIYLLLDKPDEVLTAMEDKRLKTVADLIPGNYKNKKISPVGRLDYHTTGLLLLTNDGELSHRLTSPRYNVPKVYRIRYEGAPLDGGHVKQCNDGVLLEDMDDPVRLKPSKLTLTGDNTCELTLYEGKTHEVRRIISSFGRSVLELRRIKLASLELLSEEPGSIRELTKDEVSSLYGITGL
ncbi:MAG TPA: 16S rRNA pseudouridine(516) synthase [Clostridiales bacterium]|nr:16S rRNA pseudouridine(516) synthase [Clostridiales bacterium]